MIIVVLAVLGLCFGSFVNALVWRLRQQELLATGKKTHQKQASPKAKTLSAAELSVVNGRSMCPQCKHELTPADLVPVVSWLILRGKCRYCKQPISIQYPLVELLMALWFVFSYILWPNGLTANWQIVGLTGWLITLVGLIALIIYDLKWMILPDRIIFPLYGVGVVAIVIELILGRPTGDLMGIALAVIIGGGLFWLIYQISKGKWIGGGDVKLGFLLGLIVAKPEYAFLFIFAASVLAMLVTLPLLVTGRLKKDSKVPFGPFLITATFIVVLFGADLINLYKSLLGL